MPETEPNQQTEFYERGIELGRETLIRIGQRIIELDEKIESANKGRSFRKLDLMWLEETKSWNINYLNAIVEYFERDAVRLEALQPASSV